MSAYEADLDPEDYLDEDGLIDSEAYAYDLAAERGDTLRAIAKEGGDQ